MFFLQITKPPLYFDKTLTVDGRSLDETISVIRRLNEQDVDLYAWITNPKDGYTGMALLGTACDNIRYRKSSLTRGPDRGVIETAEVIQKEFGILTMIFF